MLALRHPLLTLGLLLTVLALAPVSFAQNLSGLTLSSSTLRPSAKSVGTAILDAAAPAPAAPNPIDGGPVTPLPTLTGVSVSPPSVTGGTSSTGTVMISAPAPSEGLTVTLSSDNVSATVPAGIDFPGGATSVTFTVATTAVAAATPVTLTATYGNVSKTAALTVNPAASTSLKIDAGATAAYTDSLGNVWSADQYSSGGTVEAPGSPPTIANTADPKLFQTQRVEATAGSTVTYTLPIANGTYSINLLFAEIDGKTKGQRVFGVTANGTALLSGFDIYAAAGGANKAITKSFLVTVTTGQIALVLTGTTGQAAISAISVSPPGGGTPAADIPAPGWAEEVIPSDQSDAGGVGPSASLSVSLPSGVLENHPGSDLDVFNPVGPSISYARLYRSALAAAGTYTSGLSPGWRDNYSITIASNGGGNYTLSYPNGGAENWTTVSGTITPPSGAPYLVNVFGSALVMTFKDHSYYTYTPDPGNANNYLLTGLSNLAGSTVTINRDSSNGNRITTFTNGGASPLLTLNYSASGLANITDLYGRVVSYTFTAANLATVSQVNAASAIRSQYGYTTIGTRPYLNAVMVPDPSSGGMSEADPQYTADGKVAQLRDAEGNLRTYTYGPKGVTVSVYGSDGTLSQTWTQKFDSANQNVDKGIIDAFGNSTNLVYADAANPLKVTAATNKNGQTASASFDKYGNTAAATDLRGVVTQNTYDPAFPLGQVTGVAIGTNQALPKTPTNFTYYDGTTQVGGITQAKGLVRTMSVPTPGTIGTGEQVSTTHAYTAMGNVLTVASPGPNTSGGTVTTTYNYTSDPTCDVNGNAGTYTATEHLGQPLTVTDPLGNVTHFRYDPRGNVITLITAPVVSYPDTTVARGLRTDYAYNRYDQMTGILYPPTNPATPTARAMDAYAYDYEGGSLLSVTRYDESGTVVRAAGKGNGKEDEQKSQTGSVQQANFNYDPQYRLKQEIDGVHSQPAKSYGFDGVGNLTGKSYALGDGPQFTQYDNDNNLMQMKDGRGITTTYTRALDDSRVTGITYSDGTPTASIGTNGYDVYDRVLISSDTLGTYTNTYDDDDNLLSKTTTYTGLPAAKISYSYNNNGSRASMTTPRALSGSTYSYWTFTYGYDADGQATSVTCPWVKSSTSTGLAVLSYQYDELGRLLKQHTQKGDTYYIYNSRGWLIQQESANTYFSSSFSDPLTSGNGNTGHPVKGTIPNRTAQGQSVTGDLNYCLLDYYGNIQYDAVGNRLSMDVKIPDFYVYNTSGNYTSYPPNNKDIRGTLSYVWDNKDRMTLETTNNSSGTPTMVDYGVSGGGTFYNDNWNYPAGADLADNLTLLRGNSQAFNADDQLTTETYDGEGNRTSYDGGSVVYDANDLPTSVPGGGGATPFTQTFTSEGVRAWKLPSGGSKTYYLYGDDGDVLMELSSTGTPVITYAQGPSGLLERFQHTNTGVPYVLYLFDPNGNSVHRVRSIDPNTGSGAAVFVQDTAVYDSQGLLHADIDTLSGGFNSGHLDPVGYKGELGNYTDLETQRQVGGLYTALSGPGGVLYYDPLSGVAMARSEAASVNEYANNINAIEPALHETFVGAAGIVGFAAGGPVGSALAAGAIDAEIMHAEGNDAKTSLIHGTVTGVTTLLLGKAGEIVGGPISRYLASEAFSEAAPTLARAVSRFASKGPNCFVAGTLVQMADGSTKPIEQVRVGDLVKSRNPETGVTEAKPVTETFSHLAPQVLTLAFTDPKTGLSAEQIICTPGHPFYVDGKGFVLAGQLGIGTSIVTRAGPSLTLSATAWSAAPASGNGLLLDGSSSATPGTRVYNFTVAEDHTYFVGTVGGGEWVHNNSYPAYYEMQLDLADWGTSRGVHFNRANTALIAAFDRSSILRSRLAAATGATEAEVRAAIVSAGSDSPVVIGGQRIGFTWHHALRSQAGGRGGVMQLVGHAHHRARANWLTYHPGNRGGFAEWAKPLGATR